MSIEFRIRLTKLLPGLFFIFAFFVYFSTSGGKTPYDYFTRLSEAFLNGNYYLTEKEPWLNELIPDINSQKYFVVYPPMPAIIALPFRVIFGDKFQQQLLAHLLGAGIVFFSVKTALKFKKDFLFAVWIGLLAGFGNIIWYLSAGGSSWYLGQITGAFFLTSAIYELNGKDRPIILGLLIGAAFLSRIHLIISLPFFLFSHLGTKNIYWYFKLFLTISLFLIFYAQYNYFRFGSIFETGYSLIPGVLSEPWYSRGLIHPSYIANHLNIVFAKLPIFLDNFPYIKPSWGGLAIWITTPAFIYSLFLPLRSKNVFYSWLAIILISLVVFSHGSTGFTQFGYRFAVDFYPFLLLLSIIAVSKSDLKWHHWLLLAISILVNLWGVLWIYKFSWVSF